MVGFCDLLGTTYAIVSKIPSALKYNGPILRVMSQALGSNDLMLDQSVMSIQILLQSRDTVLMKLQL